MTEHEALQFYLQRVRSIVDQAHLPEATKQPVGQFTLPFLRAASNYSYIGLRGDSRFRYQEQQLQIAWLREQIQLARPQRVLELGCTIGFSLVRLAQAQPHIDFFGLDPDPQLLRLARGRLHHTSNVKLLRQLLPEQTDRVGTIGWVYALESFNRFADVEQTLRSVHQLLQVDGTFVLFERFRKVDVASLSGEAREAQVRSEQSYAAQNDLTLDAFLQQATKCGFELIEQEDVASAILPTLRQFRQLQDQLYPFPWTTPRPLLPPFLTANSVMGYLVPSLLALGIQGFYRIRLRKI